jgi:muconolactone D-isomerase
VVKEARGPDRDEELRRQRTEGEVEFLVRFEIAIPSDIDPTQLKATMAEERRRGTALWESGKLVRLWRVPGTRASLGLYRFTDATELHQTFSSFPLFPFMTVHSVEPLAIHPAESDRRLEHDRVVAASGMTA